MSRRYNMKIKDLVLDISQILELYEANKWGAYTEDPPTLINGIAQSLYSLGAYDEDKLVGLIRVVGDGETIIYIQDILVLPEYHRKGIGSSLMNRVLLKYKDVRQINLTTDNTEKQRGFYESLGFVSYDKRDIVGFSLKK